MYKFFTATASTAAAPSNRIYTKVNFKKESIENEINSKLAYTKRTVHILRWQDFEHFDPLPLCRQVLSFVVP